MHQTPTSHQFLTSLVVGRGFFFFSCFFFFCSTVKQTGSVTASHCLTLSALILREKLTMCGDSTTNNYVLSYGMSYRFWKEDETTCCFSRRICIVYKSYFALNIVKSSLLQFYGLFPFEMHRYICKCICSKFSVEPRVISFRFWLLRRT